MLPTPGHRVEVEVPIQGVRTLVLIVTAGKDGNNRDWADWVEPKLIGPSGEKSLLDLNWTHATSGWMEVQKNSNISGGQLQIGDQIVKGIGTHANSTILYLLPPGFERFSVTCGLDHGGTGQSEFNPPSVRFHIAAEGVPDGLDDWSNDSPDK